MKRTKKENAVRKLSQHLLRGTAGSPISEALEYHLKESIPVIDNVYRPGSQEYFRIIREAREHFRNGTLEFSEVEAEYLAETDVGEFGIYEGEEVPLDFPMLAEAEYRGRKVDLNSPTRSSGPKKYKVYTKNKKGNVVKVDFGDAKGGLTSKLQDPKARKAFADRHNCEDKKDKTKPGWWSCRLPRYAEKLGLKKVSARWW